MSGPSFAPAWRARPDGRRHSQPRPPAPCRVPAPPSARRSALSRGSGRAAAVRGRRHRPGWAGRRARRAERRRSVAATASQRELATPMQAMASGPWSVGTTNTVAVSAAAAGTPVWRRAGGAPRRPCRSRPPSARGQETRAGLRDPPRDDLPSPARSAIGRVSVSPGRRRRAPGRPGRLVVAASRSVVAATFAAAGVGLSRALAGERAGDGGRDDESAPPGPERPAPGAGACRVRGAAGGPRRASVGAASGGRRGGPGRGGRRWRGERRRGDVGRVDPGHVRRAMTGLACARVTAAGAMTRRAAARRGRPRPSPCTSRSAARGPWPARAR